MLKFIFVRLVPCATAGAALALLSACQAGGDSGDIGALRVYDRDSGALRTVDEHGGLPVAWTAEGTLVYRGDVPAIYSPVDDASTMLSDVPFAVSPDGRTIAFERRGPSVRIVSLRPVRRTDSSVTTEATIPDSLAGSDDVFAWAVPQGAWQVDDVAIALTATELDQDGAPARGVLLVPTGNGGAPSVAGFAPQFTADRLLFLNDGRLWARTLDLSEDATWPEIAADFYDVSPDRALVAVEHRAQVRIYRADGAPSGIVLPGGLTRAGWAPDSSRLAVLTRDGVALVDTGDGAVTTLSDTEGSASVAWAPDGQAIALAVDRPAKVSRVDRREFPTAEVRIHRADDGRVVTTVARAWAVVRLTWSRDGRWLAIGSVPGGV